MFVDLHLELLNGFLCNSPSLLAFGVFHERPLKSTSNELFNLMKDFRNLITPFLPELTF